VCEYGGWLTMKTIKLKKMKEECSQKFALVCSLLPLSAAGLQLANVDWYKLD
jgi:hypothetical protein